LILKRALNSSLTGKKGMIASLRQFLIMGHAAKGDCMVVTVVKRGKAE
jgi:hypothetical protein